MRDALTSREQSPDICLVETALSWTFSLSFFPGLVNQSLISLCEIRFPQAPLVLVGVLLQLSKAKFVFRGLHQLAALVLDLRTEIAWSFEEAQQAGFLSSLHALNHVVKEALFSYNTGLDSWSYSVPFACSSCGRLLSMSAIDCIEFCRRSKVRLPFFADEKGVGTSAS